MNKKFIWMGILLLLLITTGCVCKEKEGSCCKGLICQQTDVNCVQGTSPVFKGCNDKCMAEWNCEPKGLSQTIETVDWKPVEADPNILDSGEQPGWTKLIEKCNNEITNIGDAKSCIEDYQKGRFQNWQIDINYMEKKIIVVKHEIKEDDTFPILSKEPTIEPYKIESYGYHSHAIDWQGNIYRYQTWA